MQAVKARQRKKKRVIWTKMELVKSNTIEMLSRRSVAIKDYSVENGGENEERCDESDRTSLKIDLSMAEQFYYEVISSFEQEEVYRQTDTPLLTHYTFPLAHRSIPITLSICGENK